MERTKLTQDVTSTRIGFGCAGLMREPSARKRGRLLDEAYDCGIRHFDVARMYGLGAAEAEVGRFALGRRDEVVIVTKFGIEAAGTPGRLARLQGPARRLLARYPALRSYIKRRSDAFHDQHRYDVASARASLHTSLRELRCDYVDILLVHDPSPTDELDLEGLHGFLESAQQAGYVRAWGVAGEHDPCVRFKRSLPATAILQLHDDVFSRATEASSELEPLVTFGVLGAALARIMSHLERHPNRVSEWSADLGIDCSASRELAAMLLQDALHANPNGVVLYSTTRPARLRELESIASRARDDYAHALAALRRRVGSELIAANGHEA